MMTAAYHKNGNDNDESYNNEDKLCLLLKRWGLIVHVLDYVLDHMIIGLVTTVLQLFFSSLAWALTNK